MKSCTNGNVRTKTTAEARTKFFQSEVLHAIFTQGAVLCIASNNTTVVNKHSIQQLCQQVWRLNKNRRFLLVVLSFKFFLSFFHLILIHSLLLLLLLLPLSLLLLLLLLLLVIIIIMPLLKCSCQSEIEYPQSFSIH